MQNVYVFRPQYRGYAQGHAAKMPANDGPFQVILFVFALVAGATGVVFLVLSVITWVQWVSLERNGIITTGEITRQLTTENSYYITVTFTPEGGDTPQEITQIVDPLRFRQSPLGQPINVLYLPSAPTVAVIADTSTAPIRDSVIAVFWNLAFIPFAVWAVRRALAAWQFARNGQRVLGQVVTATPRDDEGILKVDVRYHFTPSGHEDPIHGQETVLYEIPPKDFAPPAVGDTVAVQFLNENRYRVL